MLVESDYDWGQDLEILEPQWARYQQQGQILLYSFGFTDPRVVYGMSTAEGSVHGFMEYTQVRSQGELEAWRQFITSEAIHSPARKAVSISFLRLHPYGIQFEGMSPDDASSRPTPGTLVFDPSPPFDMHQP